MRETKLDVENLLDLISSAANFIEIRGIDCMFVSVCVWVLAGHNLSEENCKLIETVWKFPKNRDS